MTPKHLESYNLVTLISYRIKNAGITFQKDGPKMHWLAIMATVCLILTSLLQVIAIVNAKDDIDRLFECFSVISFCGMGILKFISLYRNHKHWNFILNIVTVLEKEEFTDEEPSGLIYDSDEEDCSLKYHHIDVYTKKFQLISMLLSRMYGMTAVIYIISPFAEYALMKTTDETVGWPHILPGWAPLDSLSCYGYLFTILIEALAAVYCVCIHVAFDLTSVGMMIFICGQFSQLRDYSENIGGKGRQLQLSNKRNEIAHRRIAKCHKIHILLKESSDVLSKLLQNILGVYFFVATLTLCSVAVRLNSELSSMQLVSLLQYMCATLTQLYLFCRYGDNVLHEVVGSCIMPSRWVPPVPIPP